MKDQTVYLRHILRCMRRIEEYTKGGWDAFMASSLIQDAILRNLQTMAESTQRVDDRLKAGHPQVGWQGLSGLRKVLVHDQLGIDVEQVYDSLEKHLSGLKAAIQQLLHELEERA